MTPFLNFHKISQTQQMGTRDPRPYQKTVWEDPIGCSPHGCMMYMPDGIARTRQWENVSKAAQTGRQAEPRKGTIGHQGKGQKPYSASIRNNLRYFGNWYTILWRWESWGVKIFCYPCHWRGFPTYLLDRSQAASSKQFCGVEDPGEQHNGEFSLSF